MPGIDPYKSSEVGNWASESITRRLRNWVTLQIVRQRSVGRVLAVVFLLAVSACSTTNLASIVGTSSVSQTTMSIALPTPINEGLKFWSWDDMDRNVADLLRGHGVSAIMPGGSVLHGTDTESVYLDSLGRFPEICPDLFSLTQIATSSKQELPDLIFYQINGNYPIDGSFDPSDNGVGLSYSIAIFSEESTQVSGLGQGYDDVLIQHGPSCAGELLLVFATDQTKAECEIQVQPGLSSVCLEKFKDNSIPYTSSLEYVENYRFLSEIFPIVNSATNIGLDGREVVMVRRLSTIEKYGLTIEVGLLFETQDVVSNDLNQVSSNVFDPFWEAVVLTVVAQLDQL